ncbi:MAG TPA: hypothetical protein VFY26_13805 [Anaerolineales bacterium]|nr:hypothetical protein [Anaerolineales bacterium]
MVVENVNGTELRFKNPGSLLLIVFAFVFWGVGFLDLLGHKSAEPDLFGLYSFPLFILVLIYGCSIVIWFALFFNANLLSWVAGRIRVLQNNTRLATLAFIGIGIALWVIFEWDRWARLPGLQFAAFGLVILAFLILLFANWQQDSALQPWRRIIAYPLFALVALEVVVQAAAWMGILPGRYTIGGDFYPYERIYSSELGLHNRFTNRYGWNFPDAILDDEKKRILILGGSYVQALPILPEQHASVLLMERLNQDVVDGETMVEIVPIGMPGFGLSPFLYDDSITEFPTTIKLDEIVVFFHLGDDFQSPSPQHNAISYTVDDEGQVQVDPKDAKLRHDLTHYFLRSYLSFQLVETIRSNYLTPKVLTGIMRGGEEQASTRDDAPLVAGVDFPRNVGFVTDTYDVTEPGNAAIKATDLEIIPEGNNFLFKKGGTVEMRQAMVIVDSILGTAQEIAQTKNITLRVVTIPMFPEAFYETSSKGTWEPQMGEYDLLLPEQALVEIARRHEIPILPLAQYMLDDQLTVEEIRMLYMSNSPGSFTPQGHDYLAEAIYLCFYSKETQHECSN